MPTFKSIAYSTILLCFFLIGACKTIDKAAPDATRFAKQIKTIQSTSFDSNKDRIVFTGSSSVRFWKNLPDYYPNHQIINAGFGGSQMSDLVHYLDETVLQFAPSKVFIYEGDNDIFAKRPLKTILAHTNTVVRTIEKKFPKCQIILISPKPSITRWNLKTEYESLNAEMRAFTEKKKNRHFANVWDIMLDEKGQVYQHIFIKDGLHMNKDGYDLWDKVIRPFVEM